MLQIVIFSKEVTIIFKDLITKVSQKTSNVYNKALKFAKNNKVLVKYSAVALVAVVALVVCVVSTGMTFGFNVKYEGENIAVVGNKQVFDTAKGEVAQKLLNSDGADQIATPKFSLVITYKEQLANASNLADVIIEKTDAYTTASALKVDGEVVAYANTKVLNKLMDAALCKYYVKDAENNSTFVKDVEVVDGYCVADQICDAKDVKDLVDSLKVKTVSTVTTECKVKYSTKVIYTSEKVRGYEKVETKGKKGVKTETAVIEKLNGKETAKTVVSTKVLKKPVQKVVVKGTAVNMATATARAEAKSQGFIRPMNRGDIDAISAYWGDGRNHKAMDFSGDVGDPIFASKGGKVTYSGYDGNYGYCVVVDHGNGYKTRYAHASALCVKKGATVSQGQQIAKLGNTGRSTGPHLHFEVIKGGTRVNPAPYIGY